MATDTPIGKVSQFDDFLGDTLNTDKWATSSDSGDTAIAIPATAVVDGSAQGATAATDNNMIEIGGALAWRAQDGLMVMEARLKLDSVANVAFNVGLNDDQNEDSNTLPVELATVTFTSNAGTWVGFVFDIDATTDTIRCFAVDDDNDNAIPVDTSKTPVAGTYSTYRIEVQDMGSGNMTLARFYIDGELVGTIENAVDRDALLGPHVGVENRTASAHQIDIDYILVEKSRADA